MFSEKYEGQLPYNQWNDILSYLRNTLAKRDYFLEIGEISDYYVDHFLSEINKIFSFDNVGRSQVYKALKIAMSDVSRDYYFKKAKESTFSLLKEEKEKKYLEMLVYEEFGEYLSDEDIRYAIRFGTSDFFGSQRHKRP